MQVSLRSADPVIDLADLPWQGPMDPPASAREHRGRFLQVRISLQSERAGRTPALRAFSAAHSCDDVVR